jgi:hypothetical protein
MRRRHGGRLVPALAQLSFPSPPPDIGSMSSRLRGTLARAPVTWHPAASGESSQVPLEPDLSMWEGDLCTFVGDAKYKRIVSEYDHTTRPDRADVKVTVSDHSAMVVDLR